MIKIKVAILGSGNIGTDLMVKIETLSNRLKVAAMVGIDSQSAGLAMARDMGIETTDRGVDGLVALREFSDIRICFDATSASAHSTNAAVLTRCGKRVIDLTPVRPEYSCSPWKIIMMESLNDWKFGDLAQFG